VSAIGAKDRCAVLHAPGYVSGACAGEIHLYRSLKSTGEWWLCEADAASAPSRGVSVERIDDVEDSAS
jgi:hypothetical protein